MWPYPQTKTACLERQMANLAYGTVWRLENGYPDARTSTIRKIAGALGVEPKELVKGRE